VRHGNLEIGPRYSVNRNLKRFSPRDPGEPLDGVGPILYPPRPSTAKLPK
jgi:menaquinol-cytochrome c reductase iron-sulfur subunit